MKKALLLICMCALSEMAFAQEEKPESNKAVTPEICALQTAAGLAKYGYANYSPTALIEAAKIFAETRVQPFDGTKENSADGQNVEDKESSVSFEPAQLIADARKYAGKDKVVLAYASKVEKEIKKSTTRGALGGPKYSKDKVLAKSTDTYTVKFWAEELAEVVVLGDGDTDLDLYIYDEGGHLIASDSDYTDQCVCRWVPAWTGSFTIKIINRGAVYNSYVLATN